MPEGYVQWQEDEGRKVLDAALAIAGEAAGDLEISSEMVAGPSVPTLVEASKDAQLIVLGCRGRGALAPGLLGSVNAGWSIMRSARWRSSTTRIR